MKRPKFQPKIEDRSVIHRLLIKVAYGSTPEGLESGCWNWTGCKSSDGYGKMKVHGKMLMAHRVSYAIFVGQIAEGLTLHHKCLNRKCCNYTHLETMTQSDNTREASRRYWDARNSRKECPGDIPEGDQLSTSSWREASIESGRSANGPGTSDYGLRATAREGTL